MEYLFHILFSFIISPKSTSPKTHYKNNTFFLNTQIYSIFFENNFDFPFF